MEDDLLDQSTEVDESSIPSRYVSPNPLGLHMQEVVMGIFFQWSLVEVTETMPCGHCEECRIHDECRKFSVIFVWPLPSVVGLQ